MKRLLLEFCFVFMGSVSAYSSGRTGFSELKIISRCVFTFAYCLSFSPLAW